MEKGEILSSRLSETNFSQGRFQFRLIQDGNAVLNTNNLPTGFSYEAYFWSNTVDSNSSNAGYQVVFNESGYLYVLRASNKTETVKKACLQDCFCNVIVFREGTCWKKKLPLSNGRQDESLNGASFMKVRKGDYTLPGPPPIPKKNRDSLVLVVSVLLGGSVSVDTEVGEERAILTDWAYDCYQQGMMHALVENDEEALNDMKKLERFVMVAIWCIQEDPNLRPTMKMVMLMLEGIIQVPVPPCPSPFSIAS
ncbi:hypothetical protein H0E87_003532 [Populus deltoides]|uniref:G-type lectin S-receptor-like serine/threonine-protein kinase RLK1 n=1 Tax=Populus deltoides TaxID=3696 RepID=A0A8T3A3S0_POPDE|nr:hypothetical protein H0E87_003532 [Populus deltoides]